MAVLIIVIAGEEQHDRGSNDAYRPDSHPQELLCTLHRPNPSSSSALGGAQRPGRELFTNGLCAHSRGLSLERSI
jgi:hypothetical protein